LDNVLKEPLLLASVFGLALTSAYLKRLPAYSISELQVLFILFILFVSIKGLERSGLVLKLSQSIGRGQVIPLKLTIITFLLSMLVTNDIALIVTVPLTLALDINRKDVLVILEALAANAGSALTPFGNPQNLFIYWFYDLPFEKFIASIAPFSFIFLDCLLLTAFLIKTTNHQELKSELVEVKYSAYIYGVLLVIIILTVMRLLPLFVGLSVIVYAAVFDRESLRIDYALLFTFLCLFGLTENMKTLFPANLEHSGHTFLLSAVSSQLISNVPATLLLAKFTTQWQALLWGVNVGGFGSLMGSLANLIAYRFYTAHSSTSSPVRFTIKFMLFGYAAFFIGVGLYFIVFPYD
jgi:Na+/H+ antiporter NhaD/arsenite permease-like protein